ncbi:MAG: alpha-ketoacid dehydrogenase subunit beta [Anaerolineae bacterium]|nr:alpha-ketoacid dehydrogenase subunit beta [Anaerolineae bacterium]
MPKITYRDAVRMALADEMRADEKVIFFGEDVAAAGGVFKVTPGLLEEFGDNRVRDTPISEQAIIGAGLGAAITGLRPVVELMFADFALVCMDQIVNQVAKYRYMSGGQFKVPLVIRAEQGAGAGFGTQHSQCTEAWFLQAPGLKVVVPGTPSDAYGLLRTAIRDDNPVVFLEHKMLLNMAEDVPDQMPAIPFGKAVIRREGTDVTIVATQLVAHNALEAAKQLEQQGISAEVIDLRTLAPLDKDCILKSVAKTGRLVIVEESVHSAGWGGDVASLVADEGIYFLDASVKRVNMGAALVAYSPPLEDHVVPNPARIAESVCVVINQ